MMQYDMAMEHVSVEWVFSLLMLKIWFANSTHQWGVLLGLALCKWAGHIIPLAIALLITLSGSHSNAILVITIPKHAK